MINRFAALALIFMLAASAHAETLAARATRMADDSGTNTHFLKLLTDTGENTIRFVTHVSNTLVKITYTAECAVLGPPESWVSTTVLIDGGEANPKTGTDFALCTSTSTQAFEWIGAAKQSFLLVPQAGTHEVQIMVDLRDGATEWWLGESSLAVETQP